MLQLQGQGDPVQQHPRRQLRQQVCPGGLCLLPEHSRFGWAGRWWVQIHEEHRQEPAADGQILPGLLQQGRAPTSGYDGKLSQEHQPHPEMGSDRSRDWM